MVTREPSWQVEIIPDSEDERLREKVHFNAMRNEVIEISSDSEDEDSSAPAQPRNSPKGSNNSRAPVTPSGRVARGNYMRSRVVESSESEDESPARSAPTLKLSQHTGLATPTANTTSKPSMSTPAPLSTPFQGLDSDIEHDGSIMIFDQPKSARKPVRLATKLLTAAVTVSVNEAQDPPAPSTSGRSAAGTPSKRGGTGTPRVSKKKAREEEQAKLHDYATALFEELNRTIFNNGLPVDTNLNWNKRLLTTAGRAKWHRSRDGVQTSEIELAEKILTSFERIRNTLSHEMCHLASWVIDKEIKEGHGKFWKAWTRKVTRKYPNIDISTRHDYDIEYPYNWKCAQCDKMYGRFSKSIKPDECVCGACREGRLIPQFETTTRTPRIPRVSKMAAIKGQDSPHPSPSTAVHPTTKAKPTAPTAVICISSDSEDENEPPRPRGRVSSCGINCQTTDSDEEIEVLAMTLSLTNI